MCKKSIKNSQPFVKKMKNVMTPQGGFVFDLHCRMFVYPIHDVDAHFMSAETVEPTGLIGFNSVMVAFRFVLVIF